MIQAKHIIPREGLDHPAFGEISAGDDLIVRLHYDHPLDDAGFAATDGIISRWDEAVDWDAAGGRPEFKEAADGRILLSLRLGGVAFAPKEPLERLAEMLAEAGVGLQEVFLTRWTVVGDNGVMGPVKAPGAPAEEQFFYENQDVYFDAVFDPDAPPPATENDIDCKGILRNDNGVSIEMRAHRLFDPDVRIAYGIYENYRTVVGDDRTAEIERVLAQELQREFELAWNPSFQPWTPQASTFAREHGHIDTLVARGRRGYEMLFFANSLRVHIDSEFRQRETEVMRALSSTIQRLDLAPVVTWMRYGIQQPMMAYKEPFKYFFQLWEKDDFPTPSVEPIGFPDFPPETPGAFYDQWLERTVPAWHLRRKPRNDLATLESWYGNEFPPDLRRLLALRDRVSFNTQFVNNWVLDDADLPILDPVQGNRFEYLMFDGQRLLLSMFAGAVPCGYLSGSNIDLWAAALPGAQAAAVSTHDPNSHECQRIADSVPALRLTADLAARRWQWDQAMSAACEAEAEDPDAYVDPGPAPELSPLEGHVRPLFDFSNLYLDDPLPEDSGCGPFLYRGYATLQLLGLVQAPDYRIIAENFANTLNQRPNYAKTIETGNMGKLAITACYWLWTLFFTGDDRLDEVVGICRESASPLVRDCAELVAEVAAGRRNVGPLEDVHARREAFLAELEQVNPEALEIFRS